MNEIILNNEKTKFQFKIKHALIFLFILFLFFSFFNKFHLIQLFNLFISSFTFLFYLKSKNKLILLKLIIYLMFFDEYSIFIFFPPFNFRLWYFIIFYFFILMLLNNFFVLKKSLYLITFLVIFLSLLINFFPLDGVLFLIKNILYFFVIVIFLYYIKSKNDLHDIISFLVSMLVFLFFTGLIQFFSFSLGYDINIIKGTLRPHGYFSETTWFSQYLLFLFVFSYYYRNKPTFRIFQVFSLISLILSMSRNPIIGFIYVIFYSLLFINDRKLLFGALLFLPTLLFSYHYLSYFNSNLIPLSFLLDKFNFDDTSFTSRLDSIILSINDILDNPISFLFGSGFSDYGSTENGSGFGSKSFILILAIWSSGGIFLLSIFLYSIFKVIKSFFVINNLQIKIGFLTLSLYFLLSTFAPFHFYPLSWIIISLAILQLNKKFI